jgi:hypothetical protein
MNTWKCSMLSASIVALSAGSATAAPAVVLDYLNLRSGPDYSYSVIAIIPAGWMVDAGSCVPGWCQANVNGITGYVDANYLGFVQAPVTAYGATPYYWTYGPYDGRYTYLSYPYRDYYGLRYYPNYSYFYGYNGGPDAGPFASAYAEASDRMTVDRRQTNRPRHTPVTKNGGTAGPNVTSPASQLVH